LHDLTDSNRSLEAEDGMTFDNLGSNDGLEQTMRFKNMDTSERMLTLIELSSRKTSERKGHVGPRGEYTTVFRKTFRYAPDKKPERKLTMQCIEYMPRTRGGRQNSRQRSRTVLRASSSWLALQTYPDTRA
jgi:hypothetical protein